MRKLSDCGMAWAMANWPRNTEQFSRISENYSYVSNIVTTLTQLNYMVSLHGEFLLANTVEEKPCHILKFHVLSTIIR